MSISLGQLNNYLLFTLIFCFACCAPKSVRKFDRWVEVKNDATFVFSSVILTMDCIQQIACTSHCLQRRRGWNNSGKVKCCTCYICGVFFYDKVIAIKGYKITFVYNILVWNTLKTKEITQYWFTALVLKLSGNFS